MYDKLLQGINSLAFLTLADCIMGILKANTYLLQRHFKKVHSEIVLSSTRK